MAIQGKKADAKKLYDDLLKAIEENKQILSFKDLFTTKICHKDTFYKYFPTGSDKYNVIEQALYNNRITLKGEIRNRLLNLDQAAGLIALYKLLADKDEREALSNSQQKPKEVEITSGQTITLKFG